MRKKGLFYPKWDKILHNLFKRYARLMRIFSLTLFHTKLTPNHRATAEPPWMHIPSYRDRTFRRNVTADSEAS